MYDGIVTIAVVILAFNSVYNTIEAIIERNRRKRLEGYAKKFVIEFLKEFRKKEEKK